MAGKEGGNRMLGVAFLGLLTVVMALGVSILKNINLSISLPICFNGSMLLLYLFGIFNCLLIGVYVVIAISALFLVFLVVNKRAAIRTELSYMCLMILLWFFFVFFSMMIFDDRLIWMGDDLNHWALVVKNMYYNDKFCVGDNTHIYFTTYSEYSALPAYFALKLNGVFNEGCLYATKMLWEVVLLFPFFYGIRKKGIIKRAMLPILIIIFLPLSYGVQVMFWNTLQVDILLGIAFAHCLFLVIVPIRQDESFWALTMGILTLTLMKQTGLYLALFVIIVLLVKGISEKEKFGYLNTLKGPIFFIILSCIGYVSWNIYISLNHAVVWINTSRYEGMQTIFEFLCGKGSAIRYDTLRRAVERIVSLEYVKIGAMNCYILWIIILVCGIVIVGWLSGQERKRTMLYCILFFLGFMLWWLGVLFVTIFKFSEEEMLVLSSYDRYLQPYFIGILFAICGWFLVAEYKKKGFAIGSMMLVLCVCTYKTILFNIGYFYSSEESQIIQRDNIEVKCQEFMWANERELFDASRDRIYIISQNMGALSADYYDAEFLLSPIPVNLLCSYNEPANMNLSYCLGTPYSNDDIWTTSYTVDELSEILRGYSYLLILNCDDNFCNNYGSMFNDDIEANGLYAISYSGTTAMFERVEEN